MHQMEMNVDLTQQPESSIKGDIAQVKRGRIAGQIPFPRHSLKSILKIPEAIWTQNAGESMPILDLAAAINRSPSSSTFVQEVASSYRYGLTIGSPFTKVITLTPLGRSIVAPTVDDNVGASLRKALCTCEPFRKFLEKFNDKPLPRKEVLRNTLISSAGSDGFGIPKKDVDDFLKVILQNIEDYELAQDIKEITYLRLSKLDQQISEEPRAGDVFEKPSVDEKAPETPPTIQKPKQIFVAHGKNTKPLEKLKKILDQFKIPYKVAIDEANQGRPISQKISDLMHECSSAIFIFTKDEETKDLDDNIIYRPSDNVVFELGAASVLYGKKIVIFKETDVSFGTDFKDLGYISFDSDQLEAKTVDLMKELIGFGLLTVSAA